MIQIDLRDKVALICGAGGGGIGSAVTRSFAQAGATIAVIDQNEELNDATRKIVTAHGVRCETFVADLSDSAQAAQVIERVWSRLGGIDMLVNVAGGTKAHQWGRLENGRDQDFHDVFALNVGYVYRLCADLGRRMIERRAGGSIVNLASVSGLRSAPFHGAYGAAKAALMALTQTMAVEWSPYGIRVNAVAPGSVLSPRVATFGKGPAHFQTPSDGRRSLDPSEIASGILFLCSDLASGVSGQTLTIDAGLSCGNPVGTLPEISALMPKAPGSQRPA
jgi:NAD(P)-dependent dehydrogenase (short-subunit alcohol dehydrogenase family)